MASAYGGYANADEYQQALMTKARTNAQSGATSWNSVLPGIYGSAVDQPLRDPTKSYAVDAPGLLVENTNATNAYGTGQSPEDEYQAKLDEANAANEARHKDVLQGYDDRITAMQGYGDEMKADVRESWDRQRGAEYNRLVGAGLSGVTGALNYADQENRDIRRTDEQIAGVQSQLSADRLGFMERRTDQAPDPALYYQMIQQAGNASVGNSYGSSGAAPTYVEPIMGLNAGKKTGTTYPGSTTTAAKSYYPTGQVAKAGNVINAQVVNSNDATGARLKAAFGGAAATSSGGYMTNPESGVVYFKGGYANLPEGWYTWTEKQRSQWVKDVQNMGA